MSEKKIYITIGILFSFIIPFLLISMRGSDLLGFFVVFLATFILLCFLVTFRDQKLSFILLLAYGLRLIVAIIEKYFFILPASGSSSFTWEYMGWVESQNWLTEGINLTFSSSDVYAYLITIPYYLFGRVQIIPQMINIILGILIIYMMYKLCYRVTKSRFYARIAAFIGAVFPTMLQYSAILLRENLIIFLMISSIYYFVKWIEVGSYKNVILSILLLLPTGIISQGMLFFGFIYIPFLIFYRPYSNKWTLSVRNVIGLSIISFIIFVFLAEVFLYRLPGFSTMLDPEYIADYAARRTTDRAAYLEGFYPDNFIELFALFPIRFIYFFLAPLPWMVSTPGDLIGLLDSALYFLLIYYSFKSFIKNYNFRTPLFLGIAGSILVASFAFAWVTSNYGTAIRHRHKFAPLLIILASPEIFSGIIRNIIYNISKK